MFTYNYKGNELDMIEMSRISGFYKAACTAEYLMDNYDVEDKDEALTKGYRVREIMGDYDLNEEDAIKQMFDEERN